MACAPYGRITIVPISFGFLGFFLLGVAVFHCSFLQGNDDRGLGYLTREDTNSTLYTNSATQCIAWTSTEKDLYFDGAWRAGRAIAITGMSLAFVCLVFTLVLSCVTLSSVARKTLSATHLFVAVTSLLTLVGLASDTCASYIPNDSDVGDETNHDDDDNNCSLGVGAKLAIVAFFCLVVAAVGVYRLEEQAILVEPEPAPPPEDVVMRAAHVSLKASGATPTEECDASMTSTAVTGPLEGFSLCQEEIDSCCSDDV